MHISHTIITLTILAAVGCGRADSNSSRIGGKTGYENIDGEWFYVIVNAGVGRKVNSLGADSDTFQVLQGSVYAKDNSKVFCEGQLVDGADPPTFQVLGNSPHAKDCLHAKDCERVYVRGLVIVGADPATFQLIQGPYGKDESAVYCGTVAMRVQKADAFEVVFWEGLWQTTFDKQAFLREFGEALEGVHITRESPSMIGRAWARDGVAYYCGPARVEGADYSSFKVEDMFCASDKHRKYDGPFSTEARAQRQKEMPRRD